MEEEQISNMEEGTHKCQQRKKLFAICSPGLLLITQKLVAEAIGTFFIIFSGCGSVVVNKTYDKIVTFPGICVTWGLIVTTMVYSIGHISGAHFNPAVTVTLAIFRKFPWKEVPLYVCAQILGSILASWCLCIVFNVTSESYFGTVPAGSDIQSFVLEIIISFLLMFVIFGTSDAKSVQHLGGLMVGLTILLNVFVAGPTSGASMNPARSLGPAIVTHVFKGLWVYILGPPIGTISGAFTYNLLRLT